MRLAELLYLLQGLTDDWRVRLATPIFQLIDLLLSRQRIARFLFDNFRTRDNLKKVLQVLMSSDRTVHMLHTRIWTPLSDLDMP